MPLAALPLTAERLGHACGIPAMSACAVLDPELARAVQALAESL